MVWTKTNSKRWTYYINGDRAGYVIKVKYNNGTEEYQGIATYKKTLAISKVVKGQTLAPVKAAVERMAKAQRK